MKETDLIKAKKYVKGFFRPKLIFLMAGKIPLDMIVIKNSRGEILKSFYNYDFEINQTVVQTPINTNSIRCYYKVNTKEDVLVFEYKWSRLEKIKRKLFSN